MSSLTIGSHTLAWGERTYVMGILNITPDSFSGDGLMPLSAAPGSAVTGVEAAVRLPAGSLPRVPISWMSVANQPVPAPSRWKSGWRNSRVLPVIQALVAEFPDALISVDTWKAEVAAEALMAGASIVNDVWGLRLDPHLALVAAHANAPVILMHNRSKPANVEVRERLGKAYMGAEYDNLLEDVKRDLMDSVQIARSAMIPDEHILLDPGIGFGKTIAQNLELINRLDEIRALGFPVLLGASRKSFIGYTLDLPPDQRVEGTAAAVAVGIARGADIVRVHDVKAMVRVARMTDAIVRSKKNA